MLPDNAKGIVIIVPGICEDGNAPYVINSVKASLENGYSAVVVNHRGCAQTKLLTPTTYHGGSSFDTKHAIEFIQNKFPETPLYGISFSLGSNILTRYLGEEGENSKLSGAVVV
mmetsp:Transcript_23268/g.26676  ORF Transcript_23268/g.26676 Transcript_23268/m.26676 type:complete len:114 (+) Transcript_23268:357-698(+)